MGNAFASVGGLKRKEKTKSKTRKKKTRGGGSLTVEPIYTDGLKLRMRRQVSKFPFFVNLECGATPDGDQTVRMLTQSV